MHRNIVVCTTGGKQNLPPPFLSQDFNISLQALCFLKPPKDKKTLGGRGQKQIF